MRTKHIPTAALSLIAMAAIHHPVSAQETIIYNERFVNTTGANANMADLAPTNPVWTLYSTNVPDIEATLQNTGNNTSSGISNLLGLEVAFDATDNGYIFMYDPNPGQQLMMANISVNASEYAITRVEFAKRKHPTADIVEPARLALKVGGQWYVTKGAIDLLGQPIRSWNTLTFTLDGTGEAGPFVVPGTLAKEYWLELNFNPAKPQDMSLGNEPASDIPAASIENIGVYDTMAVRGTGTVDEFTIYAVPASASTWAGYAVQESGWVDTGNWLGFVYPVGDWVYVLDLANWVFLPESHVAASGAWGYVVR